MIALTTLMLALGQGVPVAQAEGFRLPPPNDGQHLAASLINLRIAPAAFQDAPTHDPGDEYPTFDLDWLQAADTDDTKATPGAGTPAVPEFGAKGSMRWTIQGGWGIDVHGSNQEVQGGASLQYFIVDGFCFAPQVNLWGFFQEGGNSFGGSLDLLFQWHMIRKPTWSLYGDFGCGLLGSTNSVPYDGSQFNFTPQAGLGVTFDIGDNNRWFAGVRWHHISNASLYSNNPGRDSILVYTGINFPF